MSGEAYEALMTQRTWERNRADAAEAALKDAEQERERQRRALHRIAYSAGGRFEFVGELREIAREALQEPAPQGAEAGE